MGADGLGALGGTRTPSLLIRSKIPAVQISPQLSNGPARRGCGRLPGPAVSGLSRSAVSNSVSKISYVPGARPGGVLSWPGAAGYACSPGWCRYRSTSAASPPMPVQSSSHSVETSQERVGGEHQVGQDTLPERSGVVSAPGGGLLRSCLDQHEMPAPVQGHRRRIGEDDVIGAIVQIAQPPQLSGRLLAQRGEHGPVVVGLPLTPKR